MTNEIKPGRIYYLLATLVFLAGFGGVALLSFNTFIYPDTQKLVVPGSRDLEFDNKGTYTIFNEYRSTINGKEFNGYEYLYDLEVNLVSKETGEEVVLKKSSGASYSGGGNSGRSIYDIEIDKPGVYELSATYGGGEKAVLSVQRDFMHRIKVLGIGALLICVI